MNRKPCYRLLAISCLIGLTNCTSGVPHVIVNNSVPVQAITASSGSPQSHGIDATFGAALVATVTSNGTPASGVVVTFTSPATGPSATFSDTSSLTATGTTDVNGVAVSPALTANGIAGPYTVTASVSGVTTPATFTLTNTTGAPAKITASGGTPQGAPIDGAFAAPLSTTVVDAGQNPVSGAMVTFTAPTTGASAIFADTGSNTTMAMTNSSGVATSTPFTANGTSGTFIITATVAAVPAPANFTLTNTAGAPASITAISGTPQSAAISSAFSASLVAAVVDSASNPVAGAAVTFTAPASGASATFSNGTGTETDTTDANGIATSSTLTANAIPGGPYTVTATTAGLSTPATFSLTNRIVANTYAFYLSGQESIGPNFYALAGAVEIDPAGNIIGGEQDYNDGMGTLSPEPSGDAITGGTLTVDAAGQGTLTLITNNTALGLAGVETLGVQFVNNNHAMIIQFDGTATSSGSIDLQNLSGGLSGGYAFIITGVDNSYGPVGYGGVFSISGGTTLENGLIDTNDNGIVTLGGPLSGTLSSPDSFGRGTITSTINYGGTLVALNYYVVGPEVIRIIDVDSQDSAIGSAFGQGANASGSTNASLGASVFAVAGTPELINYSIVGMLSTSSTSSTVADFAGVADDNELIYGIVFPAAPISGNYSVASNGYGSLTIDVGDLGDVSALGIYLTDPNLNLSDPNDTTGGLGGALLVDMDGILPGGTGVAVPQTDTSASSFTGNYALGAQGFSSFCCEFDFVAAGSVNDGALSGTGLLSDPFLTFGESTTTNPGSTFSGTPIADPSNSGRYTMFATDPTPNPLVMTVGGTTTAFTVAIYQASGGQLFWLDEDALSGMAFMGTLQQQGSLNSLPAAKKKTEAKTTVTQSPSRSAVVSKTR